MIDYNFKDFGFIILSPTGAYPKVKTTFKSIELRYPEASSICTIPTGISPEDISYLKRISPVYRGKNTITSLFNTGLKNGHKQWNIFVMEGAVIRPRTIERIARFIESEKDVIYPITMERDRDGYPTSIHDKFHNCSINGITIHKKLFTKVGNFSPSNPLTTSRSDWQMMACGYENAFFRGVLGVKII